jgi:hypothetical protein
MSSSKDKDMDTTIDDFKYTEKKLAELKTEILRQEEMEVLKKRIEMDTVNLRHLQKGIRLIPATQPPVATKQEADWFQSVYRPMGSSPTQIPIYKICPTTGREQVFCMCGNCQTWRSAPTQTAVLGPILAFTGDIKDNGKLIGTMSKVTGTTVVTIPLRPKASTVQPKEEEQTVESLMTDCTPFTSPVGMVNCMYVMGDKCWPGPDGKCECSPCS